MTARSARYTVRTGTRFRPTLAAGHYDVIVVGSGIGGLCTAALMAGVLTASCLMGRRAGAVQKLLKNWQPPEAPDSA